MKFPSNMDLSTVGIGLVLVVGGVVIMLRGRLWSLLLADERYLVGGAILAYGLYAIFLGIKNKDKKRK